MLAFPGLRLALHPPIVSLITATELEDKDAAVGGRMQFFGALLFDIGVEVAIGREHDQVDFGLGGGCGAWPPAEVHQLIFAVEVDVAWAGIGGDSAVGELAKPGFECNDRRGGHGGGLCCVGERAWFCDCLWVVLVQSKARV